MSDSINIYCDESCHLEHDGRKYMVLGAMWCKKEHAHACFEDIRAIKRGHGIPIHREIKWSKVSDAQLSYYQNLVDYFFRSPHLSFRALSADKEGLDYNAFAMTHDGWYYRMYYTMLKPILEMNEGAHFAIYLDIKDTRSFRKIKTLQEVLCTSIGDRQQVIVERIQAVDSKEVALVQLTDLFIGALAYYLSGHNDSPAKVALIKKIRQQCGYYLRYNTPREARKFNLFHWTPERIEHDNA
ncbi:MAG TPA: DUF3800 domain-containing protein [bacterium]|nr:DUF3800 domain-containing protein [bacterium]